MYYDPYWKRHTLYIAGPECFYENGYPQWYAMGGRAEMMGMQVTMPTKNKLDLSHDDLRKNADAILSNCAVCMNEATIIICDLEFYRGADVDGGSIFEAGMAYARGMYCYGFTRDLRPMKFKYQGGVLKDGVLYDRKGRVLPYQDLPFSPNVMGAFKILEGDFDDALSMVMIDILEERKRGIEWKPREKKRDSISGRKTIKALLAGPDRYMPRAEERYAEMKKICAEYGIEAISPADGFQQGDQDDVYKTAYNIFLNNVSHVENCDIVIADLNDFHGWEPDSDTAFECGMAFQLGKPMFGYMNDTRPMIERVPNLGAEHEYRDACGCNAENFNYPLNLMFSSSMPIYEGSFENILPKLALDLV